jgi:hypothetical protein
MNLQRSLDPGSSALASPAEYIQRSVIPSDLQARTVTTRGLIVGLWTKEKDLKLHAGISCLRFEHTYLSNNFYK